jgi:hypothetical protein
MSTNEDDAIPHDEGWTREQAEKVAEATERSIAESGQDIGATKRGESVGGPSREADREYAPHEERDRPAREESVIGSLRDTGERGPANNS